MMGMTIMLGPTLIRIMMIGNYDSDEHGDERDDYIMILARVVLCNELGKHLDLKPTSWKLPTR